MGNGKPTLMDWLSLQREPDYSKARWLGALITVSAIIVTFVLVGLTAFQFFKAVAGLSEFADAEAQSSAIRNSGLVLAAMIGVPFLVWRSVVAQKRVDVAEQGQITDRINKAVEGLGAEKTTSRVWRNVTYEQDGVHKTVFEGRDNDTEIPADASITEYGKWEIANRTRPNLEVRIGSIYALERIAQDSDRDHIQIMEILCAYTRENAPLRSMGKSPMELWAEADNQVRPRPREDQEWGEKLPKLRADIQIALQVIGRRSDRQVTLERATDNRVGVIMFRLDLSNCCLQRADMRFLNFDHADFSGTQFQGADFKQARIRNAGFYKSQMQAANFFEARMQKSDFTGANLHAAKMLKARLQKATFVRVSMQGAKLGGAKMQNAELIWVQLQGTSLAGAKMQGAYLCLVGVDSLTSFKCAKLRGSAIYGVDDPVVSLVQAQVDEMFYDGSVEFSNAITPIAGRQDTLNQPTFEFRWRDWQESIGYDPNARDG